MTKSLRAYLAWMVIAALAAHGIIPVGFMPDAARAPTQPLAMTICGGMGPMAMGKHVAHSAPANKKDDSSKPRHEMPCPFSTNALFAFGNDAPVFASPVYIFIALMALALFALAQERRFGNASPRAPPQFS